MKKCEEDLTDEYIRKLIDETIEFDRKMQDPEFLKKMRIEEEKIKNIALEALMKGKDEKEEVITSEFLLKKIDETIEFDKKMQDPEFVKAIEIDKERMRNIDFSQYFKD